MECRSLCGLISKPLALNQTQSNSIHSIRLCSTGFGSWSQSNTIQWIAFKCVWGITQMCLLEKRSCYVFSKTQNTCATKETWASNNLLVIFKTSFYKNIKSSEIKSLIWFDWVWLKCSGTGFEWLCQCWQLECFCEKIISNQLVGRLHLLLSFIIPFLVIFFLLN